MWSGDQFFTGGGTYSTSATIAGTTNDELYQTERYGNFAYHVPVPNGAYEVDLHFAEIFWSAPGQRVFDVTMEGTLALDNLDLVAAVGTLTSLVRTSRRTVSDGVLDIVFMTVIDNAKLSALEIPLRPRMATSRRWSAPARIRRLPCRRRRPWPDRPPTMACPPRPAP